jgi:hypothetical protein
MAIGRISGPLLSKNLLRDGVDLAFETDLLYLDVTNGRIGVRKNNPTYELDVNGTINAGNLRVTYTGPGTGSATLGKLTINSGTIATTVGPITIQPSGNDKINLIGDTTVTGNLHATGSITADGDITIGDNLNTDSIVFNAEVKSNIIPAENNTYDLGSPTNAWATAYVDTLVANALTSQQGNIDINPAGGLLNINGDINVRGTNPIGTAPVVTNVLYVTMDGNDTNDGRAQDPSRACKTISGAIRSPYYRPGTLIRVASGHYLENNPILMQPNTSVIGDDLRTTSIEAINKTSDLFHVQSGCYLAQMQFLNGRSGLLPGVYANGFNRGAYATAFPPQVNGKKLDVYQSPYIQNCTNQSGPWLIDGTLFVPNQTIQVPKAYGTTSFPANTTTIAVSVTQGTLVPGMNVTSGPQDPGFFNARTLMLANKEFIKDQVIAFITENYPEFQYSQAKCARDVGIIVENVAYDATFGGNQKSVESGLAYYDGVINLIEGQQTTTTYAINYINDLSQLIIRNQDAPVISTATTQVINTALTGGEVAAEEVTAGINIITSIINSGTSVAPTIFVSPGPESPLVSAEILLQANRKFLQEEVTAYVDAQYPNFEYAKDYCYRDVGLIIDAVSQDVVVGGNTKSLEAALSYYTGSKGDSSVAEQAIVNNFELIKNIILNGPGVAPAPISGPNQGTGFSNAKVILQKNKDFVQTEVSAYVRSLFDNTFRLTQAQQNLCFRDIGTILDAIAEDTAAGGNVKTVESGLAYYNGVIAILPGDQPAKTALALEYMALICTNIVKNIQSTNLYQTLIPQIVNLAPATLAESTAVDANIELITDILTVGPDIVTDKTPISLSLTTNTNAIKAFNILNANKNFLASELTGYIDNIFGNGFEYNTYKCFRDTGLIVDSIAFDLLYQGNTQAIFAGLQYYNQGGYTGQIGRELSTTTQAINYARDLAKQIAINIPVTFLQSASTQTFDLINSGTEATTATINTLFNTVTSILINGTVGVTNNIISNGDATIDQDIINAYNLVQSNKQFIEDEVIAHIDSTTTSFNYNKVKCARDTRLIVNALAQDLLFNGNSQSTFAGLQYWNQTGYTGAINSELTTTTNAIRYVRDLAIKIITKDTTGPRYQTLIPQDLSGIAATVVQTQTVYDDFNVILDIITNGTANVTDIIVPNRLTTSADTNITNAYALLVANKEYIQTEAIAYVEASKVYGFMYDITKCRRDVGYMLDSVSFDLLYGGNRQAVQSGVYYYGFSSTDTQIPNEQIQVTAAYEHIKAISSYIVTGQRVPTQYQLNVTQVLSSDAGTISQATTVNSNVDTILSIINSGPSVAAAPAPISLTASVDTNVINAAKLLNDNLEFIKAEVIAYIDQNYPVGFEYNKTTCRRDVGYILDCVCFDLLHSGNRQSIQAGVYYYGFNPQSSVLTYEITQAIAAYNRIKAISRDIIQNVPVTPTTGNAELQTRLLSSATDAEAALIAEEINIINDIINNGPDSKYAKTPIGLTSSSNSNVQVASELLLLNKAFIQNEIIAYMDYYFKPRFVFDKIKCTRDTKLIIDSLALDLIYEGNTQSQFAALQYWAQGTSTIPGEETTTTNAILTASALTQSYITTADEISTVDSLFTTVTNIIINGTVGVTDAIIPNGLPSTNTQVINAYEAILANKVQIQTDTITSINNNNPGFVYNTSTCYRDVGYIIDCVAFDLLHGGNRQSIQAGVYYFGFNGASTNIVNEIPQTVAAYTHLKYMIREVLLNTPVPRSYQVVYPQVIIPAYMGVASAIPGEENITADAIVYLNGLSQNIIANQPVPVKRSSEPQTINTFFDGGIHAGPAVARNYSIIADVILNGPGAAPIEFTGSGFFATTGVSADDVRQSPTIIEIISQVGNDYTIKLSGPTVGAVANGTLYFGDTDVFPKQDLEVEALSLEYTGKSSTWNMRKVDRIGGMGGSLVDGSVVSARSPIQSFVYDAYTQINQGGRGVHIINNGYAQLVSVFTVFCSVGVEVDNGGIASIVNSNSNFGDICLVAKGYGKREFSGTVYNPPFPTYLPNGEYYPYGYYPKNGFVEIYIPDTIDRPHISLVMEVEPPLGHTNEQSFLGFLNATPSMPTLTTGTITITGIDTTGVAIGNTLYIRDQYGRQGYVDTGTVITDVNYQSITLSKSLIDGGGEIDNPNYFTLYSCGNAYYTVLSSTINDSFGRTIGERVIPLEQLPAELSSLTYISGYLETLLGDAGINAAAITFVTDRMSLISQIVGAADLAAANAVVPNPTKTGTPPVGAGLAIDTIRKTIELIVTDTIAFIDSTYTNYDHSKCARDIRLLLVQILYDLEFGGNYYSVYSGLSYWVRSGTHHIVNMEEAVNNTTLFPDGATVNFYQRSYISASGYVFEYVGAGTDYGALPQRGIKDPVQGKEVVQLNNGKVFFTSTDQNGDFRIGPGLVISQATGVLSGRTFTKSLFANMTPFILAIEGGA